MANVVPHELGVDAALAHTTGDELRVLAAEIEHEHGPRTGFLVSRRDGSARCSRPPVVGSVLRDRDVVGMALAEPGCGDPHELRVLELVDRGGAAVPHRLPQPAHELVDDGLHGP